MRTRMLAAAVAAAVTMPLAALVASPASAGPPPVTACQSTAQADFAEHLLEQFRDPSLDPHQFRHWYRSRLVGELGVPLSDIPAVVFRGQGDVNGDARVTALDAALVYQVVDGQRTADPCVVLVADLDSDGYLTSTDVSEIQRLSVGL